MRTAGELPASVTCAVLAILLLAGCQHAPSETADSNLKIGAAEADITPPVGFRMAGYFDERLATGVHDPLKAKALVFQQGSEQFALVFCDLIGVPLAVTTNARVIASRETGIPASHITIAATHSHTGPLFHDVRGQYLHAAAMEKWGKDPQETVDYAALLTARIRQVISSAQRELRPAQLLAGMATQPGMTFNRRYWMKNGKVVCNPGQLNPEIVRPAGPADPDVGLLLGRDAATGKPFAGLTVFAMHADTLGGTDYSADYPFFIQQTLRQAFGERFVSAFGAGTCGDLNHIDVGRKEPVKGAPVTADLGTRLGETVLKATPGLEVCRQPRLEMRSTNLVAKLQSVSPEELADARSKINLLGDARADFFTKVIAVKRLDLAQRGQRWPLEVQALRLDTGTAMVFLPCEVFVELGLAIKAGSPFKKTIVISICNDRPSYVPTLKAFAEGSYEVSNARVEPGTGEQLAAAALGLLRELHP